jgi:PAS domain S-box-containing protein
VASRVCSPDDADEVLEEIVEIEREFGWGARDRYWNLAEEIVSRVERKHLSSGLAPEVLAAILDTLPVQLTFVDRDDRVRYFSHERREKIFDRSREVIGNEVQSCHPQESFAVVEEVLRDLEAGRRETVELWFDMGPRKILVQYRAVRDEAGSYLGCLETAQDVSAIQRLTGQKRSLDPIA